MIIDEWDRRAQAGTPRGNGCETKFFLVQTHRRCFAERGRPRPKQRPSVAAMVLVSESVMGLPFVAVG